MEYRGELGADIRGVTKAAEDWGLEGESSSTEGTARRELVVVGRFGDLRRGSKVLPECLSMEEKGAICWGINDHAIKLPSTSCHPKVQRPPRMSVIRFKASMWIRVSLQLSLIAYLNGQRRAKPVGPHGRTLS